MAQVFNYMEVQHTFIIFYRLKNTSLFGTDPCTNHTIITLFFNENENENEIKIMMQNWSFLLVSQIMCNISPKCLQFF